MQTTATRERRWTGGRRSLLVAAIVVLPAWVFSGTGSNARTVVSAFDFTGAPQVYLVPAGVCRVRIDAVGAAGGERGTAGSPGFGARATATFRVVPGERLRVYVGGWGGRAVGSTPGRGGWNGGGDGGAAFGGAHGQAGKAGSGGGGATDVRQRGRGLLHRIIVAGGGSGGAGGAIGGSIGAGGGLGGGLTGDDGLAAFGSANPATGGKGGSQTAGGAVGRNAPDGSVTATAGSLGVGGAGASGGISGGGGGGGGLYGGGGGGSEYEWTSGSFGGGHGGGGSGFGPAATAFRSGEGAGYGRATIGYDRERDACDSSRDLAR